MMAHPFCSFFFFCVLFFSQINSYTVPNNPNIRKISNFVLDGKTDCNILNDQRVIKNFHPQLGPEFLPSIESLKGFFKLRSYLIWFGEFDALYHLCEFDTKEVVFDVPTTLANSTTFCKHSAEIYGKLNFSYNGEEIKKWSGELKKAMTNSTLCENLCILSAIVNPDCSTMVTAANEYSRLKGLKSVLEANKTTVSAPFPTVNISIGDSKIAVPNTLSFKPMSSPNSNTTVLLDDKTHTNDNLSLILKDKVDTSKKTEGTDIKGIAEEPINSKYLKPVLLSPTQASEGSSPINLADNRSKPLEASKIENPGQVEIEGADGAQSPESNIPPSPGEDSFDEQEPSMTVPEPMPDQENLLKDQKEPDNVGVEQNPPDPMVWPRVRNNSEESFTFSYFATVAILCFAAYFLFHYKNKLLALALEGRKGRNHRGRGRPSSANYSKLHSNLEEAIASNVTTPSATHVLY